jgi:hypothetical protein
MSAITDHMESNDGYCTTCKAWTASGGIEPDACRYECVVCGKKTVFGAEECVVMGLACVTEGMDEEEDE